MKTQVLSLLALGASAVMAQEYNTSAPFTLKLESSDASIDGVYLYSCHAGAGIEELCLTTEGGGTASTYFLNESDYNNVGDFPTGPLVWNLLVNIGDVPTNVSSGMTFNYNPGSNVAIPAFGLSSGGQYVGFDGDDHLFTSSYYDESTFVAGVYPNTSSNYPIYHWQACWNYFGGYYYHALGWVTAGTPYNPTCSSVSVVRTFI